METKLEEKSSMIIGGTTLIGIGIGFIFLHKSALIFIASILISIGIGLVIANTISQFGKK